MSKNGNGLRLRGGIWHIEKRVNGRRLRESTGTGSRVEAEQYLIRRLEEIRQQSVYGVRPNRIWREAALKYVKDHKHKRSIKRDVQDLKALDGYIGKLPVNHVHAGSLQKFIDARRKEGVKAATVNRSLAVARRILRLCAELWRDEWSRPSRARGLKQQRMAQRSEEGRVAPLAGAWIETPMFCTRPSTSSVAPLAGAWIETAIGF